MSKLKPNEYAIHGVEAAMTPALAIYTDFVDTNVDTTIRLLGGNADRWRPHVKTTKARSMMERLVRRGVTNFKCSTTLELLTACEAGAVDVLVAYPVASPAARRVAEIAERFPQTKISALVEDTRQLQHWNRTGVGLFIDVNPGMDRTGIGQEHYREIVEIARSIEKSGLCFRGLHYYDGHLSSHALPEREVVAHRGYDQLIRLVSELQAAGLGVEEVITAGTPAFPCTLSYRPFADATFRHRASPGTVVYCDATSLAQLPPDWGYRPAAVVITTVVSHPTPNRVTCDAGHKTVSADAGVPTCAVLGREDLIPAKPSEEHLPIDITPGSRIPELGEVLYLIPKHVCPTVNNFDHALIVEKGKLVGIETISARGRESPLPSIRSEAVQ
ncbi:MAG TPA: D-TA family PLP-dependent enzyme [Blastocatellia bacterium]|nr:D-TA family PLP-dependent enzyme [Blastocatellia bacterium]